MLNFGWFKDTRGIQNVYTLVTLSLFSEDPGDDNPAQSEEVGGGSSPGRQAATGRPLSCQALQVHRLGIPLSGTPGTLAGHLACRQGLLLREHWVQSFMVKYKLRIAERSHIVFIIESHQTRIIKIVVRRRGLPFVS
jgi:hypothetical protein